MGNCVQTDADEQSLLAAVSRGDRNAFWKLWQNHSGRLFQICMREMRGNKADAEDALAQAMLKAIAKLPAHAGKIIDPGAWLIRFTRNLCRDIHREDLRGIEAKAHLRTLSERPYDCESTDSGAVAASELDSDPFSLITRLPPRLREVFVLRVIQQMPYGDIAAQLRISCVTARKRVQQARAELRSLRGQEPRLARNTRSATPVQHTPPYGNWPSMGVSRTVRVQSRAGFESEIEIVLAQRPCRESQKIATLRAYVARHPAGWKMRLKLAELLYATGQWAEAADCYRQVLAKRPWLTDVAAKLERIVSVIGGD